MPDRQSAGWCVGLSVHPFYAMICEVMREDDGYQRNDVYVQPWMMSLGFDFFSLLHSILYQNSGRANQHPSIYQSVFQTYYLSLIMLNQLTEASP